MTYSLIPARTERESRGADRAQGVIEGEKTLVR